MTKSHERWEPALCHAAQGQRPRIFQRAVDSLAGLSPTTQFPRSKILRLRQELWWSRIGHGSFCSGPNY